MNSIEINCLQCNHNKSKFFSQSKRKNFSLEGFSYYQCENCKGVFLNPLPNENQIIDFYKDPHLNPTIIADPIKTREKYLSKSRLNHDLTTYVNTLLRYKKKGEVLDFGCGVGWLVYHLNQRGFDTFGLDFNKNVVEIGKKAFDVELNIGDFDTLKSFKNQSFEAIYALSCIEHLTNPDSFLKECYRILKPGGIIISVVPTTDSLQFKYLKDNFYWLMAPYHINIFSKSGFKSLMNRNDFIHLETKSVKKTWYWTKPIIDKMKLNEQYNQWRKDESFVKFDIFLDEIFDDISFDLDLSSSFISVFQKQT
tara:strand:- start:91 stop:1017 length:927 start_codon:yes stop_codon:yes gene_type:complete